MYLKSAKNQSATNARYEEEQDNLQQQLDKLKIEEQQAKEQLETLKRNKKS